MNFNRVFAIIERDMRKFFRSPSLMMTSMVFPLLQLIVLGYAFGGKITNVKLALVDDDHTAESRLVREKLNSVAQGAKTFRVEAYGNLSDAMIDLKAGFIKAIIYIPPDFSQRVMRDENPRIAFIEDNTDTLAMGGIAERIQQIQSDLNGPTMAPLIPGEAGGGARRETSARSACRRRSVFRRSKSIPTSSTSSTCWPARSRLRFLWWP